MPIELRKDNVVLYKGPTNRVTGGILDNSVAGATSLLKLFKNTDRTTVHRATTRLNEEEPAAEADWRIPKFTPAWLEVGDKVRIRDEDGVSADCTITVYDTASAEYDQITVTGAAGLGIKPAYSLITLLAKGTTSAAPVVPFVYPEGGTPDEWYDPFYADTIEIEENDKTLYESATVTQQRRIKATEGADGDLARDQELFYVVAMTAGFGSQVNAGNRVRHKLGANITMSEYGVTTVVTDWQESGGFEGTIPDTIVGLARGMELQLEVHFTGGVGLFDIESLVQKVVEG